MNINKILKYGSYFLVFILPLIYIQNTFFPYTSPKTFFFYGVVEILVAFYIYALFTDSTYRLSKKTLLYFIPLFCFVGWMTIASILAVSPMLSFWSTISRGMGLITIFHCLAFSLIVASLFKKNGKEYLYKLMHWFINSGIVLAISIWVGSEGSPLVNLLPNNNGGGLTGNSSFAGAYLIFVLAFGFFLLASKTITNYKDKLWLRIKIAFILFSPIFIDVYGLITGHSLLGSARGALLGIIIGAIAGLVFYLLFSKKRNIRNLAIVLLVIGSLVFSLGWASLMNGDTKLHKSFVKSSGGARFIFMDVADKSINEHPWFGYGPENYLIAFQKNLDPKIVLAEFSHEIWSDRAHNIYYDTGVSGGYPAILFYFIFIFSIIYGLFKLQRKLIFNNIQIAILGGLVVGYVFQNLFVFDSILSLMALFVLAGIVFGSQDKLEKEEHILKPDNLLHRNILTFILLIACSISLVFFVIRPVKKIFQYYKVVQMPIDQRALHYKDLSEGFSALGEWDVGFIFESVFNLYNLNLDKVKNNQELLSFAKNDISAFMKYAEEVLSKNKYEVRLRVGILYLQNILNYLTNDPYDPVIGEKLLKIINDAQILAPKNPEVYWARAQVYYWKRDYPKMLDTYKETIAIDPSIPGSYHFLLRLAKMTDNKKLYTEFLEKAKENIPNYTPY